MSNLIEEINQDEFENFIKSLNVLAGEQGTVADKNKLLGAISSVSYYKSYNDKIASIVRSLAKNHAITDGNKRTAVLFFITMAKAAKINLNLSSKQLEEMFVKIANSNLSVEEISKLLFTNANDAQQMREWLDLLSKE